jgi:hypothetical protein
MIQQADLEPVISAHTGNQSFERALEQIRTGEDLIRLVGNYIFFNAVFGGGVANLAGEIAVRQDLFRDPSEPVQVLADRSVEVASDIFFAAVDEFDDRIAPYRDTHRSLAQATLKGISRYFGCDDAALDRITRPGEAALTVIRNVREGYGVNQTVDEPKLFRAIGFHIGSEVLADEEFDSLHRFLSSRHPELVRHLESTEVEIGGTAYPPYFWIRVHTSVEVDHFDAAVKGANTALRYYAGTESTSWAKARILEGFAEFSGVQAAFMERLLDR